LRDCCDRPGNDHPGVSQHLDGIQDRFSPANLAVDLFEGPIGDRLDDRDSLDTDSA